MESRMPNRRHKLHINIQSILVRWLQMIMAGCGVLRCVAVCLSVLQCVAVCKSSSRFLCDADNPGWLWCVAVCCTVLLCVNIQSILV